MNQVIMLTQREERVGGDVARMGKTSGGREDAGRVHLCDLAFFVELPLASKRFLAARICGEKISTRGG